MTDDKHAEQFLASINPTQLEGYIPELLPLAEGGNAKAQYYLSLAYYDDDEVEAFNWCKKSAENGYTEAQFQLGNMYIDEWGTEEDKDEIFRWWKTAAENNHPEAQFRFALLLQSLGQHDEYRQWLEKSAANGYFEAQKMLRK